MITVPIHQSTGTNVEWGEVGVAIEVAVGEDMIKETPVEIPLEEAGREDVAGAIVGVVASDMKTKHDDHRDELTSHLICRGLDLSLLPRWRSRG